MAENTIENVASKPEIFYGLHFAPGTAEYVSKTGEHYRIFLNQDTINKMNPTFAGCPVYVQHVDKVDMLNLKETAAGYVVKSFYNKADGNTWCEFLAVDDELKSAIKNGWKLSNAYQPTQFGPGGEFHAVEYSKEVLDAKYEHLACVPNPRYAESMVLSPEDFKKYNANKLIELEKISNSKQEKKMSIFNFFKKEKVELDGNTSVLLPKTNVEKTLDQLINEADVEKEVKEDPKKEEVKEEKVMANMGHYVNVGEETLTVEDLVKKHAVMAQELSELKKPVEEVKPSEEEVKEVKKDGEDSSEDVAAKAELEKLAEHEQKEIEEKKKNNFESLKNAELIINKKNSIVEYHDQMTRGKKLFGSN